MSAIDKKYYFENQLYAKKMIKKFGGNKKSLYLCTRKDGRVVECGGLENR